MINELGINLGFLTIRWYALIILSGSIIALFLSIREGKKFNIESEVFYDFFFVFMIGGILGARIYYVIFNLEYYLSNIWKIFAIYEGGIAIYGGILGAVISGYVYSKRKKYNYFLVLDIVVPGLLLAQAIGRWGNFVNKEAYGTIVAGEGLVEQVKFLEQLFIPKFIINRMFIDGNYHHPTFLYESIWNMVGFLLITLFLSKMKTRKIGMNIVFYSFWYGIGRLWIEGMRMDSLYLFPGVRISQLVSILLITFGAVLLYRILTGKDIEYYKDAMFLQEK